MVRAFSALAVVLSLAACGALGDEVSAQAPPASIPSEIAGWDATLSSLFSVLGRADVLALGEAHGRQADADLRLRIIQHPDFARSFSCVIVELGDTHDQPLIDAFVRDGTASEADAASLWSRWPELKALYSAVRAVNARLGSVERVRVLAATEDFNARDRNAFAVRLIEEQVLASHKKALLVYGAGHVWHRDGGITQALDRRHPGAVFVVEIHAAASGAADTAESRRRDAYLARLERSIHTQARPVLLTTRGTAVGRLPASNYYGDDNLFPAGTTIGDLDDAVIFEGRP